MEAGRGARIKPGIRRAFIRTLLFPSWGILATVSLAFVAGAEAAGWVQYAPFALSLILFGLPHGAVDHLVPGRLSSGGATLGSVAMVFAFYLTLAALYLLLWFTSPGLAFIFFIALTWFHWGQGDLYFLNALKRNNDSEPLLPKALTVLVRGGMPMLVPLLAFPEVYRGVAENIVGLFQGDMGRIAWVLDPIFRGACGVGFLLAVLVSLYWSYRVSKRGEWFSWRIEVAEVLILTAYFAIVPPILALGLYFCLWHSPRHIARLMLLDHSSATALEKNKVSAALAVFARDAAPLTIAALALLLGLYFLVPGRVDGAGGLLAVYLVLISTLTLPHVMIVCLMDRRQGIWR